MLFILTLCRFSSRVSLEIYAIFHPNLNTDEATLLRECQKWRTRWTDNDLISSRPVPPEDLAVSIELALGAYPNIRLVLILILDVPVSTATEKGKIRRTLSLICRQIEKNVV